MERGPTIYSRVIVHFLNDFLQIQAEVEVLPEQPWALQRRKHYGMQ